MKKKGFVHVRLDEDLSEYVVSVLKGRPGGISRFVNDKIREEMKKTAK